MHDKIVYVSVDIEADGPVPGTNSMMSIGADARLADGTKLDTFSVNLRPLPDAEVCQQVMADFWQKHPKAWEATQVHQHCPRIAMMLFARWLDIIQLDYQAKTVFVAYPLAFDYDYVLYYSRRFLGRNLFEKSIDMRSVAMGVLGVDFDMANKAHMPPEWDATAEMKHIAVEDATQQADLFFKMLAASRKNN